MSSLLMRPVTGIWLALMLATAASTWWFAGGSVAPTVGALAVIVVAGIKVCFVMSDFMGLRRAPLPWMIAGAVWLLAVTAAILIVYLV